MISLYCENLDAFAPERARRLHGLVPGGIEALYVLVWPDYPAHLPPRPQDNRRSLARWREQAGVAVYAWLNARRDQAADVEALRALDAEHRFDGFLLDIEGEWTKESKLDVLASGVRRLAGKRPLIASLAGWSPSGTSYDYRSLDRAEIACEWQAYMDSGEGPPPRVAVRELHRASWIVPGWEYRHSLDGRYGWGRIARVEQDTIARFDSDLHGGRLSLTVARRTVGGESFGWWVVDPTLRDRHGLAVGMLMGRARYARIRVALDVTRSAQQRSPEEWVGIAASARASGSRRRPVSVFLAENASDETLVAISRGAA